MPTPITPQDFSEIRWRGHWIWVPEEPAVPNSPYYPASRSISLGQRRGSHAAWLDHGIRGC